MPGTAFTDHLERSPFACKDEEAFSGRSRCLCLFLYPGGSLVGLEKTKRIYKTSKILLKAKFVF